MTARVTGTGGVPRAEEVLSLDLQGVNEVVIKTAKHIRPHGNLEFDLLYCATGRGVG